MPQAPAKAKASRGPALPPAGGAVDPAWAWAPYAPSPRCPWTVARAGHLWRRAGFGATWGELARSLADGPQRTVDRLLKPKADVAAFNRTFDAYEGSVNEVAPLRAWWLRRMIETPHPLLEKMTLVWHDLFAARAGGAALMRSHIQHLRAGAMGHWSALVAGVSRDPAVLLSLGAEANRKALPTDRFARQLLDRYTVGRDNYTPRDVREAARAMTGVFVRRSQLHTVEREHDGGAKTVLDKTGTFSDQDVMKIAAEHPAAARNVVRRLYRWLVSEVDLPADALIAPLAESLARDFDLRRLVETMLRSNLLFADRSIARRVKRPVEFAVGIIRALEATVPTVRLAADLAALGEKLYAPPTVAGWAGGHAWITAATLIGRSNLAAALLAPAGAYGGKLDPAAVARRHGHTDAKAAARFLTKLLAAPGAGDGMFEKLWAGAPRGGDLPSRLRALAHSLVTQPEYQLA